MRLSFSTVFMFAFEKPELRWPVVWDWVPPRRGTLFLHDEADEEWESMVRVEWPGVCFGTVACPFTGDPLALYAYASHRPPRDALDPVLTKVTPLDGWICLGSEAADAIRRGETTPIEAFYNTSFSVQGIMDGCWIDEKEMEEHMRDRTPLSFALGYNTGAAQFARYSPEFMTYELSVHDLSG